MTNGDSQGWFKASRTDDAWELLVNAPNAYILALIIAWRGRWKRGFDRHGLQPGEAMLGDHQQCGLTRQQYRTALTQLSTWHFATFRSTSKGTIARLTDSRLFALHSESTNHQPNQQLTIKQPSANHQVTTKKNSKKEEEGKKGEITPQLRTGAETIRLEHSLERVEHRLKKLEDGASHDAWGPHYTPAEAVERKKLKVEQQRLKAQLNFIA